MMIIKTTTATTIITIFILKKPNQNLFWLKTSSMQGSIFPFCVGNDGGGRREGAAPLEMLPLPPSPHPWVPPAPRDLGGGSGPDGALALRRRLCKPSQRHDGEQPAHKMGLFSPEEESASPLQPALPEKKKGFPRRNNLLTLGGAFCGQARVLFFEKVALFHSPRFPAP